MKSWLALEAGAHDWFILTANEVVGINYTNINGPKCIKGRETRENWGQSCSFCLYRAHGECIIA